MLTVYLNMRDKPLVSVMDILGHKRKIVQDVPKTKWEQTCENSFNWCLVLDEDDDWWKWYKAKTILVNELFLSFSFLLTRAKWIYFCKAHQFKQNGHGYIYCQTTLITFAIMVLALNYKNMYRSSLDHVRYFRLIYNKNVGHLQAIISFSQERCNWIFLN